MRHFVHYFVGAGRFVNFVAAVPAGDWRVESWSAKGTISDALAEFAGWHQQVAEIIHSADVTHRWGLYDRAHLEHWSRGRVTLLGDAAHAMLPFMAQGAAQSIEDAFVLASCLSAADTLAIPAALLQYEEIRKSRAHQVQERSRQNEVTYHLPDGDAQRRRDAQLTAAGAINPLVASSWLYGHDAEARATS